MKLLVPQNIHLLLLKVTPNLTHVDLEGFFTTEDVDKRLNFNNESWNLLHENCKHLTFLKLKNIHLLATSNEVREMKSVSFTVPALKTLILDGVNVKHTFWLNYLGRLYPNLETLDICMDNWIEDNNDGIFLEPSECCEGFIEIASSLLKLKKLKVTKLIRNHFPARQFFETLLNKGTQLEEVNIGYYLDSWTRTGMNSAAYNLLLQGQYRSLKSLSINMWNTEHVYEDIIKPLSMCTQLTKLRIENDDFTTFDHNTFPLDQLLDTCPKLLELDLLRITPSTESKRYIKGTHPLKKLHVAVATISQPLFEYLTIRCPHISNMAIRSCGWFPRDIEMRIDMPKNTFDVVRVKDMNKRGTRGLQGERRPMIAVNLVSVTEMDKLVLDEARYKKRIEQGLCISYAQQFSPWYYLYKPHYKRSLCPILRKSPYVETFNLNSWIEDTKKEQHLNPPRFLSEYRDRELPGKKSWGSEIGAGYVHIVCKSIKTLRYDLDEITYRE